MKALITISLAFIFSARLYAQNPNGWIEQGAEFYHSISSSYESGYAKYYLDEEFELNGKMIQRLKAKQKTITMIGMGQFHESDLIDLPGSLLFHTSNDTVYMVQENGDLRFAWHLDAQVGDVWDFGAIPLSSDPNQMIHAYALVVDVEEVIVSGVLTKDISIETCLNMQGDPLPAQGEEFPPYFWMYQQGKINTIFGPRDNFNYMGFYEVSPQAIYCPWHSSTLTCYRSATFELAHLASWQSCTAGFVDREESHLPDFALYPNPAFTTLNITNYETIKAVEILDVQGRVVLQSVNLPLDLSSMSKGIYWVQIDTMDGQLTFEKLVVE